MICVSAKAEFVKITPIFEPGEYEHFLECAQSQTARGKKSALSVGVERNFTVKKCTAPKVDNRKKKIATVTRLKDG